MLIEAVGLVDLVIKIKAFQKNPVRIDESSMMRGSIIIMSRPDRGTGLHRGQKCGYRVADCSHCHQDCQRRGRMSQSVGLGN